MKLDVITKVAILACETYEDARAVLEEAEVQLSEVKRLKIVEQSGKAVDGEMKRLRTENYRLKQKDDIAKGGIPTNIGKEFTVNDIRNTIKGWHENDKDFTSRELADYFPMDRKRMTQYIQGFKSQKGGMFWSWFAENFKTIKEGRLIRYIPSLRKRARGERVVVKGTSSGYCEKKKTIPAR